MADPITASHLTTERPILFNGDEGAWRDLEAFWRRTFEPDK